MWADYLLNTSVLKRMWLFQISLTSSMPLLAKSSSRHQIVAASPSPAMLSCGHRDLLTASNPDIVPLSFYKRQVSQGEGNRFQSHLQNKEKYPFNLLNYFNFPFFNKRRATKVLFLLLFHNFTTLWCLAHYHLWLFGFQGWEAGDNLMSSKHVHSCGIGMLCSQQSCSQRLWVLGVVTVHLYSQLSCRDPMQNRIRASLDIWSWPCWRSFNTSYFGKKQH